jgi:four helix bundle protein
MSFEQWQESVSDTIKSDPLWKMTAYRLALFTFEISWHDVSQLAKDNRTLGMANQLYRAIGSIAANIAEGYSRSTGKDRARFYEYALGSAREARVWYSGAQPILGEEVIRHRLDILTQIIRLIISVIPLQRSSGTIREDSETYDATPIDVSSNIPFVQTDY